MSLIFRIVQAALYGIVEGVTEWLPVSSTGHLILLSAVLPPDVSESFWNMFLVVIQLGAILAVVTLYAGRLSPFARAKSPQEKRATWRLWLMIFLSVLPAIALAPLDDRIDAYLHTPTVIAAMLILYGVFFILAERFRRTPRIDSTADLGVTDALLIGCAQALAVIPGTSRSGATILGAMLLGLSRPAAAEFSFFMAIPTMAGAGVLKVAKFILNDHAPLSGTEILFLTVGCAVAYAVSLLTIRYLLDFVRRHTFKGFGVYRIALGITIFFVSAH